MAVAALAARRRSRSAKALRRPEGVNQLVTMALTFPAMVMPLAIPAASRAARALALATRRDALRAGGGRSGHHRSGQGAPARGRAGSAGAARPQATPAAAARPAPLRRRAARPGRSTKPVFAGQALVADPALIENIAARPLPRIADDGRKPMTAYAAPAPRPENSASPLWCRAWASAPRRPAAALASLPPGVTLGFAPYAGDVQHWVIAGAPARP